MKYVMKKAASLAAIGALMVASVGTANAGPEFTVNPSAVSTSSVISATGNAFNGSSTELLHLFNAGDSNAALTAIFGGAAPFTGNYAQGYFKVSSLFDLNSEPVDADIKFGSSGIYNLYLRFNLVAALSSGTNGANGSEYSLSALTYSVFADPTGNNVFTQANGNGTIGTEASIANAADDILLAVGSLLAGDATIQQGGVALNAVNLFGVCSGAGTADFGGTTVGIADCLSDAGQQYFFDPSPFYTLAISAFNNTGASNTIANSDGTVAVRNAVGTIDFNNVPEPGSLALMGVALAGLGFARRRKAIGL